MNDWSKSTPSLEAVRDYAAKGLPDYRVPAAFIPVDEMPLSADGSVDRSALRAVQTPQGFRRDVLERAHASGVSAATDDAALVEALGVTVTTVVLP